MNPPTFSVIVPLYNKRDFVAEAVASAAAQLPPPLEIIVVDDGSTDDGAARVEALGIPTVRLLRQANAGVSAARNAGVKAACGDWVAFLDADDRFAPGHLAALQALAARFPQAGMLATGYCLLHADGARVPVALDFGPGLLDDFYGRWSRLTFTCANAIALRRDLMREQGIEFQVGEKLGEDQDVWFRMAEAAPVAYVGKTSVDYRVGVAGSATSTVPRPIDVLPCYRRLSERMQRGATPPPLRSGARRLLGAHWLNVARARHDLGQHQSAWALWREPTARGHFSYWVRTGLQWLLTALQPRSTRGAVKG